MAATRGADYCVLVPDAVQWGGKTCTACRCLSRGPPRSQRVDFKTHRTLGGYQFGPSKMEMRIVRGGLSICDEHGRLPYSRRPASLTTENSLRGASSSINNNACAPCEPLRLGELRRRTRSPGSSSTAARCIRTGAAHKSIHTLYGYIYILYTVKYNTARFARAAFISQLYR